jgi:hypothetical protein
MFSAQLGAIRKPAAIAVSSLAALAFVVTPAGATAAAEPDGEPIGVVAPYDPPSGDAGTEAGGSRWFDVYSTDGGRGAHFYGTLTWRGKAPYSGRVSGEVVDRVADGHCAVAEVALDGNRYTFLNQRACPKGDTKKIGFNYSKTYNARVRVCRLKNNLLYSCSAWR